MVRFIVHIDIFFFFLLVIFVRMLYNYVKYILIIIYYRNFKMVVIL